MKLHDAESQIIADVEEQILAEIELRTDHSPEPEAYLARKYAVISTPELLPTEGEVKATAYVFREEITVTVRYFNPQVNGTTTTYDLEIE